MTDELAVRCMIVGSEWGLYIALIAAWVLRGKR